jgi:hypothetical protein
MRRKSFGKVVRFWGALLAGILTLAGCPWPDDSPNSPMNITIDTTPWGGGEVTRSGVAHSLTAAPSPSEQVTLSWTNPTDSDFDHVEITYTTDGPQTLTVNKTDPTNDSAVITGLDNDTEYTFTVKTVNTAGSSIEEFSVSVTPGLMPFPAKPDIAEKFGYSSPADATEVTAVFDALHNWLGGLADAVALDASTAIELGNYIDLPALTVEGYGTPPYDGAFSITNTDLGARGKRLRLIVIGKNSYNNINGNGVTKHLVFHFQNFPAGRGMNPDTEDVDGYESSAMREYLVPVVGAAGSGKFLDGLVAAGVPDRVLFAPARKVGLHIYTGNLEDGFTLDGSSSLQSVIDKLFLPTYAEMFGPGSLETSGTQASFTGYYNSTSKRTKYIGSSGPGQPYWLASFQTDNVSRFKFWNVTGSGALGDQDQLANQGIAPAFCVK